MLIKVNSLKYLVKVEINIKRNEKIKNMKNWFLRCIVLIK